jgi:DNA-binding transcriptional LysR family regulator
MTEIGSSRFSTVALFCKAAETLNFSAAAEQAGTTPSAVSKAVLRLENQLGVKLFERTTRSIRLTDEGRSYHDTCRQALHSIEQAGLQLSHGRRKPQGTLRVSLPASFGILDIVPRIPHYVEAHGHEVKVVVSLTNSIAQFASEGCDIAIRIGRVADSSVVARTLREAHYCVVAAPSYVRRYGTPQRPDDLRRHRAIQLMLPDTGRPLQWHFQEEGRATEVTVPASLVVDHPLAALTAAVAGGGLTRLLDFTVAAELRAGRLVEVLREFRPPSVPVSVVYPGRRHLAAKVRTFIDFLVEAQEGGSGGDAR